ncbi:MAG TPA: hypothetical protein ENK82_01760 [Campylobacterales bacterium]|nr:hypothetical protein [Campylobacterales bacterium]HHS92048.1 hypothetical protein [Campylobacterales bacterium]
MSCFVVGDVHGEYAALLNVVAKTPKNSRLIFVGDLIDRGEKSAHVVRFVRKHKLQCVLGNHELMMIEYGSQFVDDILNNRPVEQDNMWLKHGGRETLLSYGLISYENSVIVPHKFIREFIFQFQDDIEWMKQLPLYLELDERHPSGRKVVVSHSAIAPVWNLKENQDEKSKRALQDMVLWGRTRPLDSEPIFNIFGHTPQKYKADVKQHYVNIDTGCYMKRESGYGQLSAYCVETGEIYSSNDFNYQKAS